MKRFITLLIATMGLGYLFATPISPTTAKTVGLNFFATKVSSKKLSAVSDLQLAYTATDALGNNCFYVYNASNTKGFVIVAADDVSAPILGYSDESNFDLVNIPEQMKVWFSICKKQITYAVINKISSTNKIKNGWQELLNPPDRRGSMLFGQSPSGQTAVAPLVKVFWNQGTNYNTFCPYDSVGGGRSVTGCVATAMAQVMKFWNYPKVGIGSNSYTPTKHTYEGVQTVNFDSTAYQWDSMPAYIGTATSVTQAKAIATLMYSCGVAVNMNYGASGSGAYTLGGAKYHSANWALVNHFGYNPNLQGLSRKSHSDGEWVSLIENELNDGRPLLYAGEDTSTTDGHCFVLDGYDVNNFFHFNWGWGGLDNGYFMIDSLNPGTNGIGSGSGKYNNYQSAIIGIQPATATYNLTLNNYLTPADTTIGFDNAITISTNILNNGTGIFVGDIGAAIYDTSSNFITFVKILSNKSLGAGYHYTNNLTFSTRGLSNVLPGAYYVQILARPTGGDWAFVADNGSYHNIASFNILNNTKGVVLYDSITPTTQSFTQGSKAGVSLNIQNTSANTFYGKYTVALYNLNGTLAQTIGSYSETQGLLPGASYATPFAFSIDTLKLNPGTYLIVVTDSAFTGTTNEYTGAGSYLNPVRINVLPAALLPDIYEPNNTLAKAYLLPLNFINDTAQASTPGANITASNLKDYFYIQLPAGYNYSIHVQLENANYSSIDSVYSLDALFAYSTNAGSTWTTDKTNVRTISAVGPKTIYFRVAPSLSTYSGQIGTYMLGLTIIRSLPLPVVFSSESVNNAGNTSLVKWQVANEINLASYNIERSYDGKAFNVIGTANATLAKEYSFADNSFSKVSNVIFYRIAAIDKTGRETYSSVVSVRLTVANHAISIYPNPAKSLLNLQLNSSITDKVTIQVVDLLGRVLTTQQQLLGTGSNSFSVPVDHLSSGSYLVIVNGKNGIIGQERFIKE